MRPQGEAAPLSPALAAENLSAGYEGELVLQGVSWVVGRGELVAVIGPNGGGKSTLLRAAVGLITPRAGRVELLGGPPHRTRNRAAYLPQGEQVDWAFPLTVEQVVLHGALPGRRLWARPGREARRRGRLLLERVGLAHLAQRPVGALSGGQRQRVFLARALLQDAEVLLLDEPTTGLDAPAQHRLLDLCRELAREGRTVVAATHDLNCLTDHFDRVLCLSGRVIADGPPREVLSPEVLTRAYRTHLPLLTPEGRVVIRHGR